MPIERIATPEQDLPLWSVAITRTHEASATAALAPHTLMRRAGAAVARLALALAPHARRVRIYAGPGNNGGDGFEAALQLHARGRPVDVVFVGDLGRLPPDAADACARARAAGVAIDVETPAALGADDLVIDALLGIGAARPPAGRLASAIDAIAGVACPVLAVDLPSGLSADTGRPLGDACVRAHHTLALLTTKPGLFTASGRDHAGSVWLDTLDVDLPHGEPTAWLAGAARVRPTPRRHDRHKGSFGDVAVVGGATGMTGAALLAARAAHAAGAGRVFVQLLDDAEPFDATRPELMFRPRWSASSPDVLAAATVVCGCGGGSAVAAVLPRLLGTVTRLVLDADALNAIAADTALQAQLRTRRQRGWDTVLTPHPLEAARLLGVTARDVQADRLAAAQRLAQAFACTVLLKGSGSIVAAPGKAPWINPTGNAALATAGTGDVLAGWIGGLWSALPEPGADVSCTLSAAWQHGRAADVCGLPLLRAADLIDMLAAGRGAPSAPFR